MLVEQPSANNSSQDQTSLVSHERSELVFGAITKRGNQLGPSAVHVEKTIHEHPKYVEKEEEEVKKGDRGEGEGFVRVC